MFCDLTKRYFLRMSCRRVRGDIKIPGGIKGVGEYAGCGMKPMSSQSFGYSLHCLSGVVVRTESREADESLAARAEADARRGHQSCLVEQFVKERPRCLSVGNPDPEVGRVDTAVYLRPRLSRLLFMTRAFS